MHSLPTALTSLLTGIFALSFCRQKKRVWLGLSAMAGLLLLFSASGRRLPARRKGVHQPGEAATAAWSRLHDRDADRQRPHANKENPGI